MGQATIGANGLVTSWGSSGDDVYQLINGGMDCAEITFDDSADVLDDTAFSGSGVSAMTQKAGLRSWTATITGFYPKTSKKVGNGGLVTFASGDVVHIKSWDMTIENSEYEITEFSASNVTEKLFRPGPYKWSGSFEGYVDSAAAASRVTAAGTAASAATFKISEEGATDSQLAGNIFVNGLNVGIAVGSLNSKRYSYTGSGTVAHTFPTGLGLLSTTSPYTIVPSAWDGDSDGVPDRTLTWQAYSGRTYAGAAWWKSIQITVGVGDLIKVVVSVRGAGAVTIS